MENSAVIAYASPWLSITILLDTHLRRHVMRERAHLLCYPSIFEILDRWSM